MSAKDIPSNSRWVPLTLLAVAFLCIVLSAAAFATGSFSLLGINENLSETFADVLTKYLFIVLAIERAAAVFVSMSRHNQHVDWPMRINRINEVINKEQPVTHVLRLAYKRERRITEALQAKNRMEIIDSVDDDAKDEDYIGFLTATKHSYEFQRARFESQNSRYVARVVFFAGIFLAIMGLSLLDDVITNIDLVNHPIQTGMIRFADIVITGGLLGGGSVGLNFLANRASAALTKA